MGVCGSGKTTVAERIAEGLSVPFIEGDQLHPKPNVDKMSNGIPLTDDDRWPWLEAITVECDGVLREHDSVVVSCSALRQDYRRILRLGENDTWFVYLRGTKALIEQRMAARSGHFMPSQLIESQFDTLEDPCGEPRVFAVDIDQSLDQIHLSCVQGLGLVDDVELFGTSMNLETEMQSEVNYRSAAHLGLVGLGVMGRNLAENILNKGYRLNAFDISQDLLADAAPLFVDGNTCFNDLDQLIRATERPRCILLLIKAGNAVTEILQELAPKLDTGDMVVDLGNSHYQETEKRIHFAAEFGLKFIGCGISGGAEGARVGPALMAGGDEIARSHLEPLLKDIAAHYQGAPCVSWNAGGGTGHFVKMVHNGIEYADMQLISECYQLMRDVLGFSASRIADVFRDWNDGPLESFLIDSTSKIFDAKTEQGEPWIDLILDKAEQKGTGAWSLKAALEYGAPATLISASVLARVVSSFKSLRQQHSKLMPLGRAALEREIDQSDFVDTLGRALFCAKVLNYVQGFMLLTEYAREKALHLDMVGIASGWRAGCIIRGRLLDDIVLAYGDSCVSNLLDAAVFREVLTRDNDAMRSVLKVAIDSEIPLVGMASAVGFFDAIRTDRSSANLIQAQRDFFGAHKIERINRPGEFIHIDW